MGHFLDIAHRVLSAENRPLSPEEITEVALRNGWLATKGRTPAESMRARLSTDILANRDGSAFMRTASGTFGLRVWARREPEYLAPRFKKSLLEEDIVVFPASSLRKYVHGRGLSTTPPGDRSSLISELRPMRRSLAEKDSSVIQLVSAFIVRFEDKYLTYRRTKRLPESRLHGYYSVLFGGHLNPQDILPLFDIFDPKVAHLMLNRELEEELRLPDHDTPKLLYVGLLYDNSRQVSTQHLGVVYDVCLESPSYVIGERGFLMNPRFETLEEMDSRRGDFENWSWIILDHEKERLEG